jgi:ribonuclease BN (tRNA processing enzyme)
MPKASAEQIAPTSFTLPLEIPHILEASAERTLIQLWNIRSEAVVGKGSNPIEGFANATRHLDNLPNNSGISNEHAQMLLDVSKAMREHYRATLDQKAISASHHFVVATRTLIKVARVHPMTAFTLGLLVLRDAVLAGVQSQSFYVDINTLFTILEEFKGSQPLTLNSQVLETNALSGSSTIKWTDLFPKPSLVAVLAGWSTKAILEVFSAYGLQKQSVLNEWVAECGTIIPYCPTKHLLGYREQYHLALQLMGFVDLALPNGTWTKKMDAGGNNSAPAFPDPRLPVLLHSVATTCHWLLLSSIGFFHPTTGEIRKARAFSPSELEKLVLLPATPVDRMDAEAVLDVRGYLPDGELIRELLFTACFAYSQCLGALDLICGEEELLFEILTTKQLRDNLAERTKAHAQERKLESVEAAPHRDKLMRAALKSAEDFEQWTVPLLGKADQRSSWYEPLKAYCKLVQSDTTRAQAMINRWLDSNPKSSRRDRIWKLMNRLIAARSTQEGELVKQLSDALNTSKPDAVAVGQRWRALVCLDALSFVAFLGYQTTRTNDERLAFDRNKVSVHTLAGIGLNVLDTPKNWTLGRLTNKSRRRIIAPMHQLREKLTLALGCLHSSQIPARIDAFVDLLIGRVYTRSREYEVLLLETQLVAIDNYLKERSRVLTSPVSSLRTSDPSLAMLPSHPAAASSIYAFKSAVMMGQARQVIDDLYVDYQRDARAKEEMRLSDPSNKKHAFECYRGWGSTIPLLHDHLRKSGGFTGLPLSVRGGGYFLNLDETGIVVDPGFQFLANFLGESRRSLDEVDAIVVSHDHPDHVDDLWTLDNLLYEMYMRARSGEGYLWQYDAIFSKEVDERWEQQRRRLSNRPTSFSQQRQKDTFDVNKMKISASLEGYAKWRKDHEAAEDAMISFGVEGGYLRKVELLKAPKRSEFELGEERARASDVVFWRTQHVSELPGSVGMAFGPPSDDRSEYSISDQPFWLCYSGDGASRPDSAFHSVACRSNVILVHVSEPDLLEMASGGTVRKPDHMGLYGLYDLCLRLFLYRNIKQNQFRLSKPNDSDACQTIVIGEFWGGKGDMRKYIVRQVRYWLDSFNLKGVGVVPADVGLVVDLDTSRVRCSECGEYTRSDEIKSVRVAEVFSKMRYYCGRCLNKVDARGL